MKILRLQAIICAITLSVFSAAANATTFYFPNAPTEVAPNEIFTVDIFADLPLGLFSGGTDVFVDLAPILSAIEGPTFTPPAGSDPSLSCYGSGVTAGCPPLNTLGTGLGSARLAYGSFSSPPALPGFNGLWGTITVQAPGTGGVITLGGSLADTGLGLFDATFSGIIGADFSDTVSIPVVVPVPAAVWLFGSGLLGLIGVARRRKAA